jgi:hypothetical protein
LKHPDGSSVIIVARGQAYIVNPENHELLGTFGGAIESVIPVTSMDLSSLEMACGSKDTALLARRP